MNYESPQNENIEFPLDLTEKDKELIMLQCELQHATSKEQIEGFAHAYKMAKDLAMDQEWIQSLDAETSLSLIFDLIALIEPTTVQGLRSVEIVSFQVAKAENLNRLMKQFSEIYAEGLLEPVEMYKMFEEIHPFIDGNGRTGDLLWKIYTKRKIGTWPETLPPDVFGTDSLPPKQGSVFGEVES